MKIIRWITDHRSAILATAAASEALHLLPSAWSHIVAAFVNAF